MTRRRAVLVPVVLVCVLSGCGLAPQEEPTVVERDAVPFELSEPRDANPSPALGNARARENVYFVKGERLGGVRRGLSSDDPRNAVDEVLRALVAGPSSNEQRAGLSSAIPPGLRLRVTDMHDGSVTIELSGDVSPSAGETPLTVAQIVLSVTSVSGVERVYLTRGAQPIRAPLVDGSLTSDPLTAFNYDRLRVDLGTVHDGEVVTGPDSTGQGGGDEGADAVPLDDDTPSPDPAPTPTPTPSPTPNPDSEPGSEPEPDSGDGADGTDGTDGTDEDSGTADPNSAPPEPQSALSAGAQYMSSV